LNQSIVHVALVVGDYDEAIEFFTKKLDFTADLYGNLWGLVQL
jgi:catechol 2,3-dioxygenase-like lactoylglutathione lyase family enzyme